MRGGIRRWLWHCGADVGGASDDKRRGRCCFRSRRTVPSPNNGSACNRLHSKIAHRVTIGRSKMLRSQRESFLNCSISSVQDALRHASVFPVDTGSRSEEHTSELQSLIPISYAVFCVTKQ